MSQRVSSAILVSTGMLNGHRLVFHKVGRDGSAKCNALHTGRNSDVTYGAVFRIEPGDKKYLDQAEGLGNGYEIKNVTVLTEQGPFTAFTYFATRINNSIKPFHWYKNHVLLGAAEHRFPDQYIIEISRIISVDDHDFSRMKKETDIHKNNTDIT